MNNTTLEGLTLTERVTLPRRALEDIYESETLAREAIMAQPSPPELLLLRRIEILEEQIDLLETDVRFLMQCLNHGMLKR